MRGALILYFEFQCRCGLPRRNGKRQFDVKSGEFATNWLPAFSFNAEPRP